MPESTAIAQEGDIALLVSAQKKRHILRLEAGGSLQTHRGVLLHDDLIGKPFGTRAYSHLGSDYLLLQPSLADLIMEIKRNTQIMYPKDIGYTLVNLDIGPGRKVLEAGTGSGSLTTALAFMVGPQGKVYSYDNRPEMQNLARKNLERVGLSERVEFKIRDINDGFDETGIDTVFLDIPNPFDYMLQVRAALKSGGFFGSILPTTNQVSKLMIALRRANFGFIDTCEILLRYYKSAPERLRPTDRMVAHTGFLIYARSVIDPVEGEPVESLPPESGEAPLDDLTSESF
jgi:tRNA (adenine57-N1/adenine58-N1)-methyltransferase